MKRGPKPKGNVAISWNPEFAYAIGLLVSDGCLSKDGRHINLTPKAISSISCAAISMAMVVVIHIMIRFGQIVTDSTFLSLLEAKSISTGSEPSWLYMQRSRDLSVEKAGLPTYNSSLPRGKLK